MRKRRFTILLMVLLQMALLSPSASWPEPDETLQPMEAKLDRWDVDEAWQEAKAALAKDPKDPRLLELASAIAFHRGEYPEALRLMKAAVAADGDNEKRRAFVLFYEETLEATASLKKHESPHFILSVDEKQDGILVGYLTDAMEKTYERMAGQYGFTPKEKIRIEVFPDTKSFHFASTLSARDIEVTGAVGLAKFNKLMLLSPRALVHGYRWLDAISHEYMHYLILKMTGNKAPIWFHEGLAKYEETRWRGGPSYDSPLNQSLLAKALAEDKLIGFKQMEPSLIRLETPEQVQLAYAQAASAIEFIVVKAGHHGLQEVMRQMTSSLTPAAEDSLKVVLGLDFADFEKAWREFLSAKNFKVAGLNVRRYKIKEGRADEERLDMAEIKSMVARNKAHLGDLLKERGRNEAAVAEYRRALTEDQDSVPILTRLSSAEIHLGRYPEALEHLKRAKALAPDQPTIYANLGQAHLRLKEFQEAREAFITSIQINPFDPDIHRGLATAYQTLGEDGGALREEEIARKLGR